MGVEVPNPERVDSELISAVHQGCDGADIEIRACGEHSDRPGLLKVHSGTVHMHYGDYDVVGVAVNDDYTLVHVE